MTEKVTGKVEDLFSRLGRRIDQGVDYTRHEMQPKVLNGTAKAANTLSDWFKRAAQSIENRRVKALRP